MRLLGFGPSFQRHIGHVVHRGFYGPGIFRLIRISHDGGTFSHTHSHPFPGSPSLVTIKDKPSDMGIKNITDKESWTEAKKFINARLRHTPYWPDESKELATTDLNAAANV